LQHPLEIEKRRARSSQRGSVLLEFALISLFFYILLAFTIDMGRMIFTAQVLQEAARVTARELAVTPLPWNMTFDEVFEPPVDCDGIIPDDPRCRIRTRVFDPTRLVIDLAAFPDDAALQAYLASLPVVNQALRPVMIVEQVTINGEPRRFMRYPGALVRGCDADNPDGFTVEIPFVAHDPDTGAEIISWGHVIEEAGPGLDPFPLDAEAGSEQGQGLASVRINYPFQAATLTSYRPAPPGSDSDFSNILNPYLA
jgi:hypothetical protein